MARKKHKIHYIYKTTCNVTSRYYIGMHSTSNLTDGYMGSGKRLRHSIRKYGVDNHKKEIIEFFETRELLIEAEKKAITPDMITDRNCMNLKHGGEGGWLDIHNKAFKDKLTNDEEFYKRFSLKSSDNRKKEYEDGIREVKYFHDWSGLIHSDETKQLMSNSSKGIGIGSTNSQYGTSWITKEGINKKIKKEDLEIYLVEGWIKGRK